jgi:hypothetical protein
MNEEKTWYARFRQKLIPSNATFNQIQLLSYHLPKTAGTSLYLALEQAYGKQHIQRMYDHSDIAKLLLGKPVWVPKQAEVMHGHFRPHPKHSEIYPNAKRIIWVRDPINWCWSTFQHYLWQKNGKVYAYINEAYLSKKEWDRNELFIELLNDPEFDRVRLYFSKYNKHIEPGFFDFVGKSEDFKTELGRLGELLNKEFIVQEANKNPNSVGLKTPRKTLYPYFKSQYQFIKEHFGIDYSI